LLLPRVTRFETTTRSTAIPSTGTSLASLTTIHQYGSGTPFQRIETKFGLSGDLKTDSARKKIAARRRSKFT
jgi:hypothetical protein